MKECTTQFQFQRQNDNEEIILSIWLIGFLKSRLHRWSFLDLVNFILIEILPNAFFRFSKSRKSKVWSIKEEIVINEFIK